MEMQPGLYIKNMWKEGTGAELTSLNPATDEVLWKGKSASKEDVNNAVKTAKEAFPSWARLSLEERKAYLLNFTEVVKGKQESLAEAISQETGKPLWESAVEAAALANKVTLTVESYDERCAKQAEAIGEVRRSTRYKPHGVVAVLGPFNLPMHLPNGHILPALLAGNTVVFKPSEQTPMAGQKYMECWKEVNLPDGVLNMVQGGKKTGTAVADNDNLNGLFFTGSYQTGNAIHKIWAGHPEKILVLEMGGNNPLVIDGVGDIAAACYITIESAFITSGQRCVCARRLIIVEDQTTKQLLSGIVEMAKAVIISDYTKDPQPFMGPLINKEAANNVLKAQEQLIKQGGHPLLESTNIDGKAMLTPGIIDMSNVDQRNDEEIFGPILQVIRVKTLDDAIKEANNTQYGLAAGILSDRRRSFEKFYRLSRSGIVNWNRPITGSNSKGPFGGIGKSGNFHPCAYFAPDYCSYPVATIEMDHLKMPAKHHPGIKV